MTSDQSLERRVTRLENDRDALYVLIDEFRAETRARFDRIEGTLVKDIRSDVNDLRTDVNDLRTDVNDLRTDVNDLRATTNVRFDRIEGTLAEVLRRLPEAS